MSATTDSIQAASAAIQAAGGVIEAAIAVLAYRDTQAKRPYMIQPTGSAPGQGNVGWQQPTQPHHPSSPYTDPWHSYPPPSYPASPQPPWQQPFQHPVPQRTTPGAVAAILYGVLLAIAFSWIPVGAIGEVVVAIGYTTVVAVIWLVIRRQVPEWSAWASWLLATGAGVSAAALFLAALMGLIR